MAVMDRVTELSARSRIAGGDDSRIRRVMDRARRGGTVTLGFLGGSITQGASASCEANRYANRVTDWWRAAFPKAEIRMVNAGIGATGSLMGAHRVGTDLLRHAPDVVTVEYAVNDVSAPVVAMAYEGLIRHILASAGRPGLMLVFMTNRFGQDTQEMHRRIGEHYRLPMVSFRDAVWPEVQAGTLAWEEVEADEVHPNDCGHELLARFLTDRLEEMKDGLDPNEAAAIDDPLPEPMFSDLYVGASILGHLDLKPAACDGWEEGRTLYPRAGWIAGKAGGTIAFDLRARSVGVIYKKFNTNDMGRAEARIDGGPPILLEGHFPCYWGGYAHAEILASDLADAPHRLEITFLEEHDPESTGTQFMICGLMVA
jgi:lysophospholipase L1-like esterase